MYLSAAGLHPSAEQQVKHWRNSSAVGWMAPEVLEQAGGCATAADVWSLGMTAIELASGSIPMIALPPLKIMMAVLRGAIPPVSLGSAALRDIVAACLQMQPDARPSMSNVLDSYLSSPSDTAAEQALTALGAGLRSPHNGVVAEAGATMA